MLTLHLNTRLSDNGKMNIMKEVIRMVITYQTAQIATIVGIHPNTVRLYEELELISRPQRLCNGYRVFTELHLDQLRLARKAFQVEILQNGLRKKIIQIIKLSAKAEFNHAILLTQRYIEQIRKEQYYAEEAIEIARQLLADPSDMEIELCMTRKQTSDYLQITMDTLRNWEMNGLIDIKRSRNGYRVYTGSDLRRLKLIRSLRCANYSLAAILRMLTAASKNPDIDLRKIIDTPGKDDDIITACDKLLTSLKSAEQNAKLMQKQLEIMKEKYANPTV